MADCGRGDGGKTQTGIIKYRLWTFHPDWLTAQMIPTPGPVKVEQRGLCGGGWDVGEATRRFADGQNTLERKQQC